MQDTQDSLQNIYQMVYTFLSCSLEEAREGYATRVDVTLFSDGFIQAKDDGRGILLSPDEEKSEEIFRDILEGRPFTTQDCRRMGGLYPPDLQWVNSLSESLTVTVHREGRRYRQDYHRGVPLHRLTITPSDAPSGTSILLRPDRLLFKEATPSAEVIRSWLQEQATGLPLLTVRVKEETSSLS